MKKALALLMTLALAAGLTGCSAGNQSGQAVSADGKESTGKESAEKKSVEKESAGEKSPGTENPETVKIALINALSGTSAEAGQLELAAATLAVKRINEAGGIKSLGGAKLELVSEDYTSSTENTKNVVERVLSRGDIVAGVGGTTSGLLLPTLSVWENYGVPIVTENNAPDLTKQGYNYVFSVHCRAPEVGEVSVDFIKWMAEGGGQELNKAAIIYENSAKGIASAEGARSYCEEAGLEIVYDESHINTITDVTSIVTAAKSTGANVCFIYTLDQVSKLLFNTMNDMKWYPVTITSNTTPSFAKALGESINGVLVGANWYPTNKTVMENEEYKKIVNEYEETNGFFMDQCAGGVYSSVMIIAEALETCKTTDGEILCDTIASGEWECMLGDGKITFNEAHESVGPHAVIGQWQSGEIVTIYPENMATGTYMTPDQFERAGD